jgi:lysylphosphatidylglycerol synthetase-like protein (DUF2156 family)/membrane associated rhomboid family serine protease
MARAVVTFVQRRPFTVIVTAVILLLAVFEQSLFGTVRMMRWDMGAGLEPIVEQGHWWAAFTWMFFTTGIAALLVALVASVVLLGIAERVMGVWRTVIAFFGTGIVGVLAGVAVQLVGSGTGEFWSRNTLELVTLDPLTPVAGAVMAASGFMSVLWRRQVRVLTLLVLLVFLLYSGHPGDLYRLLAALTGLLLGLLLRPNKHVARWVRGSGHEIRNLLAVIVAISAVGPVIAFVSGSRFGPLAPIVDLLLEQSPNAQETVPQCQAFHITRGCVHLLTLTRISNPGAVLVSIAPLILLLACAYGLLRARRFAVWVAAAVNLMLGLLSAFYFGILPVIGVPYALHRPTGTNWEILLGLLLSIALPLGIAAALIVFQSNFPVVPSRRRVRNYLLLVAGAAIGLGILYVGGGLLLRDTAFTRVVGLGNLLGDVLDRFVPVSFLRRETLDFLPSTFMGGLLYYGVGPVFWGIVIIGAWWPMIDSPARSHTGEMSAVRERLMAGGGDALSFMATWPGNWHWFDPSSRFVITYRVFGRVALTIGGPFGARAGHEAAMGRFARFCDDHGWIPVFYSVDAGYEGYFRSVGWNTMVVAEETIIRPENWQTTGKKWQDIRTSINRAQRAGIRAVWTRYADLSIGTANQVAEISEQWVSDKALPEMGFTLGGLDELRDPAVRLMLAIGGDGVVHAVTSWLPSYRDEKVIGWTLDFMRRRSDSSNGVMEFVIAETAAKMRDERKEFLSLSGAPLAHTASNDNAEGIDRLLNYLSESLEPVYGFRSLLKFKKKFQPEFHPALMAYPDPTVLPAIGLALTRAYLPQLSMRNAGSLLRAGS